MPEEFDPAWEFYVADPEIEEVTTKKAKGFEGLPQGRGNSGDTTCGFAFRTLPKTKHRQRGDQIPPRPCQYCKKTFDPDRERRKFCSCACAAKHRGVLLSGLTREQRHASIREKYMRGDKIVDIAVAMKTSCSEIWKVARKMNLPYRYAPRKTDPTSRRSLPPLDVSAVQVEVNKDLQQQPDMRLWTRAKRQRAQLLAEVKRLRRLLSKSVTGEEDAPTKIEELMLGG